MNQKESCFERDKKGSSHIFYSGPQIIIQFILIAGFLFDMYYTPSILRYAHWERKGIN